MKKIAIIAKYLIKDALRDRFFLLQVTLIAVAILFAKYLANFGISDTHVTFIIDMLGLFYYVAILIPLIFIPLKIHQESSGNLFLLYRSKPMHSFDYVGGKFLGFMAIIALELLLLYLLSLYFVDAPLLLAHYYYALFLELSITTAAAIFFGIYATSTLAILYTVMFFVLAHSTYELAKMAALLHQPWLNIIAKSFYYLFPTYDYYDLSGTLIYHYPLAITMPKLTIYTLAYVTLLLFGASWYFRKKEL